MLKKIKKLKGVGIFQDFNAQPELQEFSRFNLIYGWNGSGKTTLSNLLSTLESKMPHPAFPNCEFEIHLDDNSVIKHNSLQNYKHKTFVFNQAFVEDNIDWKKQGVKSIVVIAEDKIEQRNRFFELKRTVIPKKQILLESLVTIHTASEKERDDFLTNQARSIKQSFQLIDTSDRRYLNYDRSKLRDFIKDHEIDLKKGDKLLSTLALEELRKKVRPIQKTEITFIFQSLQLEKIEEAENKIKELLQKSVLNQSIERLQKNTNINKWVQEGLHLHTEMESKDCEFCMQPIPGNRLNELEKHFSKGYTELMEKLNAAKGWLASINIANALPDISNLYDEIQPDFKKAVAEAIECEDNFKKYLQEISDLLDQKIANPFNSDYQVHAQSLDLIKKVLTAREEISKLIGQHNKKTQNFQQELASHKNTLELHFITDAFRQKNYFKLMERIEIEKDKVHKAQDELQKLQLEAVSLEGILANVSKGAEDFNNGLHAFLGRSDLLLQYDNTAKGYKILRSNSPNPAQNLSEGEKTAIAFVYFMTKLKENGNVIDDSIIIVDDPISSFDSNHLFHSLAYLKAKCEKARQLFILTHNFQYFKLVRDWILGKNKDKTIKSAVYSIEVEKGNTRKSGLFNAHPSLLKYGSEYHFLFTKLYAFKKDNALDVDKCYQVANYARKLLEGFFTFKHPKARANFAALMEAGCKEGKVDQIIVDKVYRFINKYSHNQLIEFFDSPVDNLMGEGENITDMVFDIIKKCDEVHFNELEEMSNN